MKQLQEQYEYFLRDKEILRKQCLLHIEALKTQLDKDLILLKNGYLYSLRNELKNLYQIDEDDMEYDSNEVKINYKGYLIKVVDNGSLSILCNKKWMSSFESAFEYIDKQRAIIEAERNERNSVKTMLKHTKQMFEDKGCAVKITRNRDNFKDNLISLSFGHASFSAKINKVDNKLGFTLSKCNYHLSSIEYSDDLYRLNKVLKNEE